MSRKRKGVGFGPRKLTDLARAPKRARPQQPTFDEMVPPVKEEAVTPPEKATGVPDTTGMDPEVVALARERGVCHPDGTPTIGSLTQAARELAEREAAAPTDNGVAPQLHAPDEPLDLPVWDPEDPGVPQASSLRDALEDSETPPGDPEAVPEVPVSKTPEAPAAESEDDEDPEAADPVMLRLQSQHSAEWLEQVKGRILRDRHHHVLLQGPAIVRKPSGALLAIYLPGVLKDVMAEVYDRLHSIRMLSDNRGLASGSVRVKAGTSRTRTKPIMSGVMGSMDPVGPMQYCRLTAYTAKNVEKWNELLPLWQAMAEQFKAHVPDRYKVQVEYAERTPPEWVIPGTPYTTITINNSYSTGVHTDSGDLDAGFSCLAVARRGQFKGGALTFPQFGVGVDMQDGDLVLMDAHEWHGNTLMICACGKELGDGPCRDCGAERISVVAYYRTKMETCGSYDDETAKKAAYGARRLDSQDENAADLAAVTARE